MRTLGATIEYRNGYYYAQAPGRLRGAEVRLPQVTVMGTENALMAAALTPGTTIIRNAACEPHVQDLCRFLNALGAQIEGIGQVFVGGSSLQTLASAGMVVGPISPAPTTASEAASPASSESRSCRFACWSSCPRWRWPRPWPSPC